MLFWIPKQGTPSISDVVDFRQDAACFLSTLFPLVAGNPLPTIRILPEPKHLLNLEKNPHPNYGDFFHFFRVCPIQSVTPSNGSFFDMNSRRIIGYKFVPNHFDGWYVFLLLQTLPAPEVLGRRPLSLGPQERHTSFTFFSTVSTCVPCPLP